MTPRDPFDLCLRLDSISLTIAGLHSSATMGADDLRADEAARDAALNPDSDDNSITKADDTVLVRLTTTLTLARPC